MKNRGMERKLYRPQWEKAILLFQFNNILEQATKAELKELIKIINRIYKKVVV